jgi:spore germination protein GerM
MRRFVLLFVALALVMAGLSYWYVARQVDTDVDVDDELEIAGEMGTRAVTLYFGNSQGDGLISETRTIQARRYRDEEVEAVVAELLRGPERDGVRSFPEGTLLRRAFYDEDNHMLYLDFNGALVAEEMGGSTMELMTMGSLLRTIAVDFPEVAHVQFLVEGLEVETLGGNVDLTRPLRPGDWL